MSNMSPKLSDQSPSLSRRKTLLSSSTAIPHHSIPMNEVEMHTMITSSSAAPHQSAHSLAHHHSRLAHAPHGVSSTLADEEAEFESLLTKL